MFKDCSPLTRKHFPDDCEPLPEPTKTTPVAPPVRVPAPPDWLALWGELHRTALAGTMTRDWLREYGQRVPSSSCSCQSHFAAWMGLLTDADLATPNGQFAATVALHNSVNAKLGKAIVGVGEARERWGTAPTLGAVTNSAIGADPKSLKNA